MENVFQLLCRSQHIILYSFSFHTKVDWIIKRLNSDEKIREIKYMRIAFEKGIHTTYTYIFG